MAMTKTEIARELADAGIGKFNQMKNVLDALAEIAQDEIASGEKFTLPGIASISWRYTTPRTKGEMYKKGDTYTGFGGVEQTAERDSPERKASVKLVASPAPQLKRLAPKSKDRAAQRRFLSTKAGKRIAESNSK